jgi:hypothetical protein
MTTVRHRSSRGRRRRCAALAASLALAGLALAASMTGQFLTSDEVPRERTVPERDVIDSDLARSKLHLGPVHFLPSINVTNAGYDSNVFATSTDPTTSWTATVAAGTRVLLPLGTKMYLVGDIFPQYTWYSNLTVRDRWGGTYDAAILGFFNRLKFQAVGADRQSYELYSSELPAYVFSNIRSAKGNVEVDITHSLSLIAAGGYEEVRYTQYAGPPLQDVQVKLNNSDDSEVRGGLRYNITENWDVAGVVEEVRSVFQFQPELRDNQSTGYLGSITFNVPRLFINAIGGYRDGRSLDGSAYPEYQTGVGSYFVSFFPLRWIELQTYGRRRVAYSIQVLQPYYFENRVGAGANIEFFDRFLLRGFVEDGPNTYPEAVPVPGEGLVDRVDHTKYYGGGLSIKLPARMVLTGLVTKQIVVSNVPDQSRNFLRFTAFLNFSGEYSR